MCNSVEFNIALFAAQASRIRNKWHVNNGYFISILYKFITSLRLYCTFPFIELELQESIIPISANGSEMSE